MLIHWGHITLQPDDVSWYPASYSECVWWCQTADNCRNPRLSWGGESYSSSSWLHWSYRDEDYDPVFQLPPFFPMRFFFFFFFLKRSFSGHRNIVCRCDLCTRYFLVRKKTKIWMIFRLNVLASQPHIFSPLSVMQEVSRAHTHKQSRIIQLGLCASHTFWLCSAVAVLCSLFSSLSLWQGWFCAVRYELTAS